MRFSPLPHIPRSRGDQPDPTRPLRSEPVRREEVRVYRRLIGDGNPQWLVTMPPGTYRLEEGGKYFVGHSALWQPLMDELAAQYAAQHEYWRQRGFPGPQQRLPSLEISFLMGFEYTCEQCGARFLAYKFADNIARLCSDKCERGRTAAQQRTWREATQVRNISVNIIAPVTIAAWRSRRPARQSAFAPTYVAPAAQGSGGRLALTCRWQNRNFLTAAIKRWLLRLGRTKPPLGGRSGSGLSAPEQAG